MCKSKTGYGGGVTGPRSACHSTKSLLMLMNIKAWGPQVKVGGKNDLKIGNVISDIIICERPHI